MRVLVTGGAGFIGSHFVQHLLHEHDDCEVVNLDALTYAGNPSNLDEVRDNARHTFIRGRIEDGDVVSAAMRGVDVVVNMAAESHVDRSILQPQAFIQTNVVGTQVLLEAARQQGVSLFCQVSTDEVYGALELESADKFTETSPLRPNSPYAASKAAADLLARSYYRTFGLPVVITRCSNNYGPRQHPEKFLPTIILQALRGQPIPVYGDGRYVRDWIYVRDHCRALDTVLQRGRPGEVYNIGGANEVMNIDLAQKVLRIMGKPVTLLQRVQDRPGHDRRYAVDSTRLEQELGWRRDTSFDHGLAETVAWYQHAAMVPGAVKGC